MNAIRVGWLYLKVGVMNELQYRVNFFVQVFQALIQLSVALVVLSLVYSHTTTLHGWTKPELLTLMGVGVFMSGVRDLAASLSRASRQLPIEPSPQR